MARVPITVMGFRCDRCSHEWIPRGGGEEPRICPKCKSPYWNRPRKDALPMTYELFRDTVKAVLTSGPDVGMTWTEVRTRAKLAQVFPNNQWVRRMEGDIGLQRERDAHGIMHWNLPEVVHGADTGTKPAD